jgi:7-cyano-7-deazaguanine reductase
MAQARAKELKSSVLGKNTKYVFDKPNWKTLETFTNRYPHRDYLIQFNIPEFTNVCPLTKQPDFAKIHILYIPDDKCIESKSLKLYIVSFRNFPEFHEDCVNRILDDCVKACKPRWMQVLGKFNARGGISITSIAEYTKKGFKLSLAKPSFLDVFGMEKH